ncbi:MAG: hypothetical protein GY807_13375 [Gammaproteobacteria bacterium]|nr:hypothetical protein [Gammaproteobacteria bacterium]
MVKQSTVKPTQPPDWYGNISHPSEPYALIGYGRGESEQVARLLALDEIANQLRTHIRSYVEIQASKHNGQVDQSFEQQIQQETDLVLQEAVVIRREQSDSMVFIAMRYDHLPLIEKIKATSDAPCKEKNSNPYLAATPLMHQMQEVLGCQPRVQLVYQHGQWYLLVGGRLYAMSDVDYQKLFTPLTTIGLDIRSSKKELHQGDIIFIEITSKEAGYINYLQVYKSGQVVVMLENHSVDAGSITQFPDPDQYDGLNIELPPGQTETRDLHLVLRCEEKKDWTHFERVGTTISHREPRFGRLLQQMEGCTVAGIIHRVMR